MPFQSALRFEGVEVLIADRPWHVQPARRDPLCAGTHVRVEMLDAYALRLLGWNRRELDSTELLCLWIPVDPVGRFVMRRWCLAQFSRHLHEGTLRQAAGTYQWTPTSSVATICRVSEGTKAGWDPFESWTRAEVKAPMAALELADVLGVKRQTFRLWVVTGRVPAFKVGKTWQCVPRDVVAHVTKPLSMWAQRESTSVVYLASRRRLLGTEPPPIEENRVEPVRRPSPGISEVASEDRPIGVGVNVQDEDNDLMVVMDARRLGALLLCPTSTVKRMADAGELPGFLIDGHWRFEVARVLEYLQKPATVEAAREVNLWEQPPRSRARRDPRRL